MTGRPHSVPAPPHALRAGDHKRPPDPPNPGRKDPRLTHLPSPPSTPCAERRRRGQGPSAAHAVGPRGPIPDPNAATGVAQKQRRTTEKRSTIRVSPSLTSPVPFRDDNAVFTASAQRGYPPAGSVGRRRGKPRDRGTPGSAPPLPVPPLIAQVTSARRTVPYTD